MNEIEKESKELYLEIVKEELKNGIPNGEIAIIQHLQIINQELKSLLLLKDASINHIVRNYRNAQKEQEKVQGDIQEKIIANAKGVYNNIMGL